MNNIINKRSELCISERAQKVVVGFSKCSKKSDNLTINYQPDKKLYLAHLTITAADYKMISNLE